MNRLHIMLQNHNGNWIINLSILLYYDSALPANWPCEWNTGKIPFTFNFYSLSKRRKRLINIVKTAHRYLEERTCLTFEEHDPKELANQKNLTYLYYVFTGALENCCLRFYTKDTGRRMVLLTPICRMPGEVAHAILHGMGLVHNKGELFNEYHVRSVLFSANCKGRYDKIKAFVNE